MVDGFTFRPTSVQFFPDRRMLVAANDGQIYILPDPGSRSLPMSNTDAQVYANMVRKEKKKKEKKLKIKIKEQQQLA